MNPAARLVWPAPAAPLWLLAPALVLLPLALLLPQLLHGGGWDLVGQFAVAALQPSLDPVVLGSVLGGFDRVVALRDGQLVFDQPLAAVTPAELTALYAGSTPEAAAR